MSHLKTITFDAVLEDDNITVPANYRDELAALFKDKKVRVTLQSTEVLSKPSLDIKDWQKSHNSFIQYLIDNPLDIADPVRMTKEELHER